MLAFWTGRDAARVDHLFRQSGLMRPKWDQKHFSDGRTYGQATVDKAVRECRESYEPRAKHDGGDQREGKPTDNRVTVEPVEPPEWDDEVPWPELDPVARYGIVGSIIDAAEEETEADPAALLFTLLTAAGNIMGNGVCVYVHAARHPARLATAIVGETYDGAKGTSWDTAAPFLEAAAPTWFGDRVLNGFGSGEGIISELRPREDDNGNEVPVDPRMLIQDPEFGRILAVNNRDNSTQSMILRYAWDGTPLRKILSKDKIIVRDHHVSVVAHITPGELCKKLTETDMTGGFANRFLYVCSTRARLLPEGGYIPPDVIGTFAKALAHRARPRQIVMKRTPEAVALWDTVYRSEPKRKGVIGDLTARARPYMLRLSVLYAALDDLTVIEPRHILAAQAAWRYSVASVERIFGHLLTDPVQNKLLWALRDVFPRGLTGREQAALFDRNLGRGVLSEARAALESQGLVRTDPGEVGDKGGRAGVISFALPRRVVSSFNSCVRSSYEQKTAADNAEQGEHKEEDRLSYSHAYSLSEREDNSSDLISCAYELRTHELNELTDQREPLIDDSLLAEEATDEEWLDAFRSLSEADEPERYDGAGRAGSRRPGAASARSCPASGRLRGCDLRAVAQGS
jgi:hypothetical protein